MTSKSGQVLLLAILITIMLVLAIPVVVYLSQIGSQHTVASEKRSGSIEIARAGIAYAEQVLATNWNSAVQGNWTWPGDPCYTVNNTGSLIDNNQVKLYCGNSLVGSLSPNDLTTLQPYQVAVLATALDPSNPGTPAPVRALQAYVALRTVGAALSDGYSASAALQMGLVPSPNPLSSNQLVVHWGPIVCNDSNNWELNDPIDSNRFPRKFSGGPIVGSNPAYPRCNDWNPADPSANCQATTDHKEYWAYASNAAAPAIDMTTYAALADSVTLPVDISGHFKPTGSVQRAPGCVSDSNNQFCGHYQAVAGSTYTIFDYNSQIVLSTGVIFIEGLDVTLENISIDFEQGAFIVNGGTITLDTPGTVTAIQPLNPLHVPPSASLDYPYGNGPPQTSNVFNNGIVNFRGFMYATGALQIGGENTTNPTWNLVGTVRVDYGLNYIGPGQLEIAYDDITNHSIYVLSPQLQVEHIQEVPAVAPF